MPLYDFQCTKCEHVFEDMAPSDGPFPPCPECSSPADRLLSAPNFAVKGRTEKAAMRQKKAHDEWKAERHPPVSDSSNSTWSPSNPSQYNPEIPALNFDDPPPLPAHPRGRTSRTIQQYPRAKKSLTNVDFAVGGIVFLITWVVLAGATSMDVWASATIAFFASAIAGMWWRTLLFIVVLVIAAIVTLSILK